MSMLKLGIGSKVEHTSFGLGVVVGISGEYYNIYFVSLDEAKEIDRSYDGLKLKERITPDFEPIAISDIENAIEKVLAANSDLISIVPIANKWLNGTVKIMPGSDDLQGKEIPIRTFFNKIIMIRERLRVLEQNINNHKNLDEAEKLHLQQYISRAYGSLTTFNVLFSEKEDQFKGMGKSN